MSRPDTDDLLDDATLENLFEQARAAPPALPEGVMARVVADAQAMQPADPARPFWPRLLAAIGGLPALGGLAVASCVGFWLAVAPPDGLPDLAGQLLDADVALEDGAGGDNDSFGWDLGEG